MGKFRIALLGSVAAMAFGASASAADLLRPVAPAVLAPAPFTWSGVYVGVHAGYIWGDVNVDVDEEEVVAGGPVNGFIGGVLGGINFQQGNMVWGLEGDFGWTGATGHGTDNVDIEDDFLYELHWDAHFRGRIGLVADRALFFIAGGLALANLDVSYEAPPEGGVYTGFTLGAGVDYAFSRNLIGRAEVLWDKYATKSYSGPDYDVDFSATTVRAALIYKFD